MRIQSKLLNMKTLKDDGSWQFKDLKEYTFNISHNNGKTTLEQDIKLTRYADGFYVPEINISDFKEDCKFTNSKDAMLKYADWLMRLGVALRVEAKRGNFSKVEI